MFELLKALFQWFMLLFVIPALFIVILLLCAFMLIPFAFIFASWYMRIKERKLERRKRDGANVAFFHPYCNAGGGGERVLWFAIKALLIRYPDSNIHIYTVETSEPQTILNKAQNQFNIKVDPAKITFVRLTMGRSIEAKSYPYFTLLLQSLGSMILGMEAFMKLNPDIYIDTTGCAFTYPIFRHLAQCPVASYTHYPTVTSAMMRRVKHRIVTYNNSGLIARNPLFTWCKLLYYNIFGWVSELKQLRSLVKESDPIRILSVAQFRPEKDHPLMLQAMYELRNLLVKNEMLWNKIQLVLVGSCRDEADAERVRNLKDLASHLALEENVTFVVNAPYARLLTLYQTSSIALHTMWNEHFGIKRVSNLKDLASHLALEENVTFVVNAPYSRLLTLYQTSSIALHTMWNEHFGISVVECMAAGLITIAHRSGGPLCDIIETSGAARTGYLASEAEEYARALLEVIALSGDQRRQIIEAARASVDRFSEIEFDKAFLRAMEPIMKLE